MKKLDARAAILEVLYATTRFSTRAQGAAPQLADLAIPENQRDLLRDRLQRVRAAAVWAEHAIHTGDNAMPPEVAAVLKRRYHAPKSK